MTALSIIVVNWNVRELLRACLGSIYAEEESGSVSPLEVIVVDNASTDGSAAMVCQRFPQARLIANAENVGFTRANNQGLREGQGRYLLLLNPDTVVVAGALQATVDFMEAHYEVGAVGPQLLFPDGRVQSSRRRFPSFLTGLVESTVVQRYWPDNAILRRYYVADRSDDVLQEVDWVVGAAIMVRRTAMEQVGVLDEQYYMYSEELDWCLRMKKAGWKVVYLPTAKVIHHEARSSDQNVVGRNIYFHDSKCKYFTKHHGRLQGGLLRAFIFLTYLFQLAEESLKYIVVARNRPMRRKRLAILLAVTRGQLVRFGRDGSRTIPAGPRER